MTAPVASREEDDAVYRRQGFGTRLGLTAPFGLLIVDFVNGFADPGSFGGGNIAEAIQATTGLLAQARARRWPVAHSRIVFADDASDANVFSLKVPSLLKLTEQSPLSAIVPQLAPREGELVVRKTVPSAFFGTGLAPWLTQRGVSTLVVAGTTTSGCVRASVIDAMSFGFRPVVLSDCVGDRALPPHDANLFDMDQKCADVMTMAALFDGLGGEVGAERTG
ncbi:isochorismatase family protein [Azospirillum picis]|uniref:Maleamate amidohydrolase n=1 Tax=Azospirillum picis TaxID=488438 RepID=A0ABU0MUW0_9PROT|nr:isochorismatase family protein [Azospirillum picis]MBP2303396.1 maleamate amidohydrolase [Azospirillum picis]MDQ0537278.1 maleamate amidohydrolase [Azospirillum picis]